MKINIVNYFNSADYDNVIHSVLETASKLMSLSNKEINIILVDDDYIQDLNKRYRNLDVPTDVLTFDDNTDDYLGDVFINLDRVETQRISYDHSWNRELGFLTCHGLLHTLGYDHVTEEDEEIMTGLQEEILTKAKLTR